jgi:hypothetical protein
LSKISFVLDDDLLVTAPVHIRMPKSVTTTGGVSQQAFVKKTIFVTFRVPDEDVLEDVQERIRRENEGLVKRLAEAERDRLTVGDDEARIAGDAVVDKIRKDIRDSVTEQLKEFIVGLPDNHGIGEQDGTLALYSVDLVERLCKRRHTRTALWDAFLLVLNGDPKKGN